MADSKWLILCAVFYLTFAKENVIIEIESGPIKGVKVDSIVENEFYYSFMGIPYAEPPVGELRFMAPKPHPKWTDVLDATKERKHCPQFYLPARHSVRYGFCGQEDCLHLSVHTPKLPSNNENLNFPVIVFIQNDLFRNSNNGTKDFGPDFFMNENAILINVHYRLGAFGFLSYEDDLLPGNNGLRDIILALKWIQANVNKFGGDASRVTLMGHGGGAALVDILLHSPKAKGLFNNAILQSGSSWSSSLFNEKEKGRYRAKEFAEGLKLLHSSSSLLLKELNRYETQKISDQEMYAVHSDETRILQQVVIAFTPVIEHDHPDAVITKLPDPADVTVPVMIGYNTREALEGAERFLRKPQYLTFADRDFMFIFPIRVNYRFELNSNIMREAIQEIKDFYLEEGYVKISKPGEFITYMGDIEYFYSIDYTVRKYTNESASPVYYYSFDFDGDFNWMKNVTLQRATTMEGTWGASRGDELCYLFVCKKITENYKKAMKEEDSEEMVVLKRMTRMWTNFAKTSNPTPPGEEFTWTPASKENKECLVISDTLEIKNNVNEKRIQFWDKFLVKYAEMAVDGVLKDMKDEL